MRELDARMDAMLKAGVTQIMSDHAHAVEILTHLEKRKRLHRVVKWHVLEERNSYYNELSLRLVLEVEEGFDVNDCVQLRDALDATKLDLYIAQTYEIALIGWSGPQWGRFPVELPLVDIGGMMMPPVVVAPQPIPIFDNDDRIRPIFRPVVANIDMGVVNLLDRLKITRFEFANREAYNYRTPAVFFATEEDSLLFKLAI